MTASSWWCQKVKDTLKKMLSFQMNKIPKIINDSLKRPKLPNELVPLSV